jgi:CRISPR-associated protein Csx3
VRVVSFDIPGGRCTPDEFVAAVLPIQSSLVGPFGVVIDGRGPIWGYGMLIHAAHASRFVATRDPRLGDGQGAVIVESHHPGFAQGEVLSLPEDVFPDTPRPTGS